jgi:HEAT repeat protein
MEDSDEDIRDWATFGLGSQYISNHPDSSEIRTAFRKRLDDTFSDARDEAVWALALRKDPQGLQLLIDRLSAEPRCRTDKDTAEEILDLTSDAPVAELVTGLQKLRDSLAAATLE